MIVIKRIVLILHGILSWRKSDLGDNFFKLTIFFIFKSIEIFFGIISSKELSREHSQSDDYIIRLRSSSVTDRVL